MNQNESISIGVHHEAVDSQITETDYVKQETTRSCGVAVTLMARNILIGKTFPYTVSDTLDIMQKKGYSAEALGRTHSKDRKLLINQLNDFQETRLIHKSLDMPSNQEEYFNELEKLLLEGAIVVVGFKKPYFDLPQGMEVETREDSSHGALVHGIKYGPSGKREFIVTDPEAEIADLFGKNIEVPEERLYESLSRGSQKNVEVIFTAV